MGPIIPAKLIGHTKNFKLKKVKRKHFKKFLATVFSDPLIYKSVLISNGLSSGRHAGFCISVRVHYDSFVSKVIQYFVVLLLVISLSSLSFSFFVTLSSPRVF